MRARQVSIKSRGNALWGDRGRSSLPSLCWLPLRVSSCGSRRKGRRAASALGQSAVATVVTVGDRACITSGFGSAASSDRRLARQRMDEVGGINPLTVLALSTDTRGRLTVVMGLKSSDAADADVTARQKLARGEAPDQGGTFDERFTVTKAEVADTDVILELTPTTEDAQLLADFDRGGLLFASC